VDLDLLRSLNIGRRMRPPILAGGPTGVRTDTPIHSRSRRSLLISFEEKLRLVDTIFSLNVSEKCEDILLCDLLLLQLEAGGSAEVEAVAELAKGCQKIGGLRAVPHIDCDWSIIV
jgi:hypothetical protein